MRITLLSAVISLWQTVVSQQQLIRTFQFPASINSICVSGDDLFAGGATTIARRWKLSNESFLMDYPAGYDVTTISASVPPYAILYAGLSTARNATVIFQVGTRNAITGLIEHSSKVTALGQAPKMLISAHEDGSIVSYRQDGVMVQLIAVYKGPINGLTVFNAGSNLWIFGVSNDGNALMISTPATAMSVGKRQIIAPVVFSAGVMVRLYSVATDGLVLYAAGDSPFDIYRWQIGTVRKLKSFSGHSAGVNSLQISGDYLFSGSDDTAVKQWRISTGKLVRSWKAQTAGVESLAIQNPYLFTGSADRSVKQWLIPELEAIKTASATVASSAVPAIASSAVAAITSTTGISTQPVGLTSTTLFPTFPSQKSTIVATPTALSTTSSILATNSIVPDTNITPQSPKTPSRPQSMVRSFKFTAPVYALAVSIDGDYLFASGLDTIITQWDLNEKSFSFDYYADGNVTGIALDYNFLIASTTNANYDAYTYLFGTQTPTFLFSASKVNTLTMFNSFLFSGHEDGSVMQWQTLSISDQPKIGLLAIHNVPVRCLALTDDSFIFSAGADGIIIQSTVIPPGSTGTGGAPTVNLRRRQSFNFEFAVADFPVYALSRFGDYVIAAGDAPYSINVWDVYSNELIGQFYGHTGRVNALAAIYDFLFSASDDRSIMQWQLSTGQLIRWWIGHGESATSLAISGQFLFSASTDMSIYQWLIEELAPTTTSTADNQQPNTSTKTTTIGVSLSGVGNYGNNLNTIRPSTFMTSTTTTTSITSSAILITSRTLLTKDALGLMKTSTLTTTSTASKANSASITVKSTTATSSSSKHQTKTSQSTTTTTKTSTRSPSRTNTQTSQSIFVTQSPRTTPYDTTPSSVDKAVNYIVAGVSLAGIIVIAFGVFVYQNMRSSDKNIKTANSESQNALAAVDCKQNLKFESFTNLEFQKSAPTVTVKSITSVSASLGANSTLVNTKNQGLYVPGDYLLDANNALYKPQRMIYQNRRCEVHFAQVLDAELRKRCRTKFIAVKVLRKMNTFSVESFYQEVSIMYFFLGKPNFVQLVGFCNAPYQILTDFYSLGNLKQCLIGNRLIVPSKQLIHSFALQISGALALMHSSGFAHADIKAMNVFVDRDARGKFKCYLGDFGLAQILDDSHLVVKVHKIFNAKGLTVAYAAPELMLRLRSRDPGYVIAGWKPEGFKRSDVYSLSILFYELLNCLAAWDLAYST